MAPGQDFTFEGLAHLLTTIKSSGYEYRFFTPSALAPTGECILRHDVDLDLTLAVRVAEIEERLGARSTFFVLTTTDAYNPLSRAGRMAVSQILALGHRLGLHFDPTAWADSATPVEKALLMESRILEDAFGVAIEAFSFHRPGAYGSNGPLRVGAMVNAYSPCFTEDISYSSDSTGWWRYGSFLDSDSFARLTSVQLLLHPVWWTSGTPMHPGERLDQLVEERSRAFRATVVQTVSPYGAYLSQGDMEPRWPAVAILRPQRLEETA